LFPFGTIIRNLCRNELLLCTGKLSTMYCPVFFALPDIKFQKGVFLSESNVFVCILAIKPIKGLLLPQCLSSRLNWVPLSRLNWVPPPQASVASPRAQVGGANFRISSLMYIVLCIVYTCLCNFIPGSGICYGTNNMTFQSVLLFFVLLYLM
jgi:hypothetical protein